MNPLTEIEEYISRETAYDNRIFRVRTNERFLKLKTNSLKNLYSLTKGELSLYLYLLSNINRDVGYTEVNNSRKYYSVWANLDFYYRKGFLVTARTQSYISNQIGFSQANISRWLKKLKEKKYVRNLYRRNDIVTETVVISGNQVEIEILVLGVIVDIGVSKEEVFLYESDGMLKQHKGVENEGRYVVST